MERQINSFAVLVAAVGTAIGMAGCNYHLDRSSPENVIRGFITEESKGNIKGAENYLGLPYAVTNVIQLDLQVLNTLAERIRDCHIASIAVPSSILPGQQALATVIFQEEVGCNAHGVLVKLDNSKGNGPSVDYTGGFPIF